MRFDARLSKLEVLAQPGLCLGLGLSGLLAYAQRHPRPPLPDDQAPVTGLQRLLEEARRWQEEHPR